MENTMQYGKLIRDMAEKLGKTRREMSYEWKKAVREINNEQMNDPHKYSLISKDTLHGDTDTPEMYEIFKQRFIDNVTKQSDDDTDPSMNDIEVAEDEFQSDIEDSINAGDEAPTEEPIDSDETPVDSDDVKSDFSEFLDLDFDLDDDEKIEDSDDDEEKNQMQVAILRLTKNHPMGGFRFMNLLVIFDIR